MTAGPLRALGQNHVSCRKAQLSQPCWALRGDASLVRQPHFVIYQVWFRRRQWRRRARAWWARRQSDQFRWWIQALCGLDDERVHQVAVPAVVSSSSSRPCRSREMAWCRGRRRRAR